MSEPRPVIVVTGRHRPHEQLLLAYSALLGLAYLGGTRAPGSVVSTMPPVVVTVWAGALLVSGLSGLVGCWWRGERGLGMELGALLINAGALLMYSVSAFSVAGMRALLPAGIVLAWALANMWRAGQTLQDLQSIRGSK